MPISLPCVWIVTEAVDLADRQKRSTSIRQAATTSPSRNCQSDLWFEVHGNARFLLQLYLDLLRHRNCKLCVWLLDHTMYGRKYQHYESWYVDHSSLSHPPRTSTLLGPPFEISFVWSDLWPDAWERVALLGRPKWLCCNSGSAKERALKASRRPNPVFFLTNCHCDLLESDHGLP
jgi:hypothetical protein